MALIANKELIDWVRSLPERDAREGYNPFDDPHFDVDKLKVNEIEISGKIFAKIPIIKDRIRKVSDGENNETGIELVTDRYRDDETGKIREETVHIGTDISWTLPGMMFTNENYHEYFDREGRLYNDPLGRREEKEREKAKAEAAKKAAEKAAKEKETRVKQEQKKTSKMVKGAERTVDEIRESLLRKERELDEKLYQAKIGLQEIKQKKEELDELIEVRHLEFEEQEKAHLSLLRDILHEQETIVQEQAKRKPDLLMKRSQIRLINEILKKIQDYLAGSDAGDYLHLAEEPHEDDLENHPGTTYSEMAILLVAYSSALQAYAMGYLYEKIDESMTDTTEDE